MTLTQETYDRRIRRAAERADVRREAVEHAAAGDDAAAAASMTLAAREAAGAMDVQASQAAERARLARAQADEAAQLMLEEYDDVNLEWASTVLMRAKERREASLAALKAKPEDQLSNEERACAAQLARNNVAWESLRHMRALAPDVDGNRRRGQYLAYRRGGKGAGGKGRHYPIGGYWDAKGDWRSATLQGCPREVRLLLASPICHDIDFVNSLPKVASQLDRLGLCDAAHLVQLKHYVEDRQAWFDQIIDCHKIPSPYDANTTAKDVAKALPIRLLHGGTYLAWVRDFGLEPRGVESGTGGYWRIWRLARELKAARADTVATVATARPEWVRQALGRAEEKKAKGRPLALLPRWECERIRCAAEASVFATIVQDKEDECLMTALCSLATDGWRTHSLQQDGLLVEEGVRADGSSAVPLQDGRDGAVARAERAIAMAHHISMSLLEKPFHHTTLSPSTVPDIIARFAAPDAPLPCPPPKLVSGRPVRLTAAQMARSQASAATAEERRAARGIDAAYEASARAAEAEAAEWDARAAATRVFLRVVAAETQRVLQAATEQFSDATLGDVTSEAGDKDQGDAEAMELDAGGAAALLEQAAPPRAGRRMGGGDNGDGGGDMRFTPMDVGGEARDASTLQPGAPAAGTGAPAAGVREMAAGAAQATDGYAADGEAIATDGEASGRSSVPRRERGKRGKQKSQAERQRQAAWKAREAAHAAVLEDMQRDG